jgi:hypothetical protein
MKLLPALLILAACKNDCVHMCQRMDRWVTECGYSWEATFEDEGWESIDDCYDDHWEAEDSAKKTCKQQAGQWDRKECY